MSSTMSRTIAHRFGSQNSTLAPESRSAKSSSSDFHHALSGTHAAPIPAQAQNITTHSTVFAVSTATRSPGRTPSS